MRAAHWMDDAPGRGYIPGMPDITLTNDELQAAAMGCRVAMAMAERDAAGQDNPRIKQSFTDSAARYSAIAARFENARENIDKC